MKICIIGNSHAAALKLALGNSRTAGRLDFDFYALPGGAHPLLKLSGGRFYPVNAAQGIVTTIAGVEQDGLDTRPYDGLVISACGWMAARDETIVANPISHPLGNVARTTWAGGVELSAYPDVRLVSSTVFSTVVESYIRAHASVRLARVLSRHFRGPVVLQPWPAPSRALKSDSKWYLNARYGGMGPQAWLDFFQAQRMTLESATRDLGERFALLDYPLADTLDDGFMDVEWCQSLGAWHGNARYGRLVVDQIAQHWK